MPARPMLSIRQQRAMALIVALVFLLMLTLLGVASMQNTVLQERMAGNFAERNQAFQFAELAVRTVEEMHKSAIATGGVVPASHDVSNWPASCPAIFDAGGRYTLGCSGAAVAVNSACLASLSWQNIPVTGSGSAQFVVVPLDHVHCGTPEDETLDSSGEHGAFDLSSAGGANMILVLGRGRGPSGTSEVVLQTLYSGGALHGF